MASKRHIRRKSCGKKVRYETTIAAKAFIDQRKLRLNVYNCDFCGGVHVGHPKGSSGFNRFNRRRLKQKGRLT